jgi:predicted CopG family antitoxin
MATKTITVTEDAYDMLTNLKLENESFSEEIKRILTKRSRKNLMDFYGILSDKEGEDILKSVNERRKANIKLKKKRLGLK